MEVLSNCDEAGRPNKNHIFVGFVNKKGVKVDLRYTLCKVPNEGVSGGEHSAIGRIPAKVTMQQCHCASNLVCKYSCYHDHGALFLQTRVSL